MTEAALINDNYNSSFYFAPGKTYRLRVINMSGFATFYFDIDGHDMDIIEVDGVSIKSPVLILCQRVNSPRQIGLYSKTNGG